MASLNSNPLGFITLLITSGAGISSGLTSLMASKEQITISNKTSELPKRSKDNSSIKESRNANNQISQEEKLKIQKEKLRKERENFKGEFFLIDKEGKQSCGWGGGDGEPSGGAKVSNCDQKGMKNYIKEGDKTPKLRLRVRYNHDLFSGGNYRFLEMVWARRVLKLKTSIKINDFVKDCKTSYEILSLDNKESVLVRSCDQSS